MNLAADNSDNEEKADHSNDLPDPQKATTEDRTYSNDTRIIGKFRNQSMVVHVRTAEWMKYVIPCCGYIPDLDTV